jgi:hypothetical protein
MVLVRRDFTMVLLLAGSAFVPIHFAHFFTLQGENIRESGPAPCVRGQFGTANKRRIKIKSQKT